MRLVLFKNNRKPSWLSTLLVPKVRLTRVCFQEGTGQNQLGSGSFKPEPKASIPGFITTAKPFPIQAGHALSRNDAQRT